MARVDFALPGKFPAPSTNSTGGVLSNSPSALRPVSGSSQNALARILLKAAISSSAISHHDHADVPTFIVTGWYERNHSPQPSLQERG